MQIIILLLMLFASVPAVEAVTRYASVSGSASAPCTTRATPCSVTTLLATLVAGDEGLLLDGTYPGNYVINGNAGTSLSKITLRAENRHAAIISTASACDSTFEYTPNAFTILEEHWIIDGFNMTGFCVPVSVEAQNAEVRYNMMQDCRAGVNIFESNGNIHHNAIANCFKASPLNNDWAGVNLGRNVSGTTVYANWIYSIGNRRFIEPCCGHHGVGIILNGNNDNNLIQGNVVMDMAKTTIRIFGWTDDVGGTSCLSFPRPACPQSTGNIVRDNIVVNSSGGGIQLTENASSNTVTNNFVSAFTDCVAGKGNDPGGNTITHNTCVRNAGFTYSGLSLECGPEVNNVCVRSTTLKNNLFYSTDLGNNKLVFVQNYADSISVGNYNLVWQNDATTANWSNGYTYGPNDIHAFASRPTFENEALGDFRLAAGSPGKNAGDDGQDMGAVFNSDLRIDWLKYVWALAKQESTVSGSTSTSFTTVDGRNYQVWVYVDNSSPHTGNETVTVEGVAGTQFSMANNVGFWVEQAPQRWLYMTTRASTGTTYSILWTSSSAFDKVMVRLMPTIAESFAQLISTPGEEPAGGSGQLELRVIRKLL